MITLEEEKKEKEFLKETSKKLENTINELKKEVNISFSDLTDFKKLVWEDSSSFDSADQVQAKQLTNEEEVKILRKEDYLKKLLKIEKKPYFGSIIYKDNESSEEELIYISTTYLKDDNDMNLIYDTCIETLSYLSLYNDKWKLENEEIKFQTEDMYNYYIGLISKVQKKDG